MNLNITGPDKLDDEHIFQVHEFCLKCKNLNYVNNDSLKSMKWTEADWFAHFIDDKIVSLSGVHKFLDGFRVLFRGATWHGITNKLLNKEQAYAQMAFINNIHHKPIFYFTLNTSSDHGAKSNRLRKWVHSGRGWPGSVHVETKEIYGVKQEIWKI
mgnify:FL=1